MKCVFFFFSFTYNIFELKWCFIAENANNEIGASNECSTEDLAKEMKNKKVILY